MNLEVARLKGAFETRLCQSVPDVKVLFDQELRLPHISVVVFEGINQELLLFHLQQRKIAASAGGDQQQLLEKLLTMCGYPPAMAHSAISFALSRYTTEEEVDEVLRVLSEICLELRLISKEVLH
jgi:cysteine desulfurase